ncbi:hypothetical protein PPERSA_13009 [Pseudocohnilembus persalinus]|uniref:Uncharacterized protein n=1 Tax=Pseudocohnilembus persalinus TaxID=266149 RepID=A0A0V0R2N1_PSEPJ|nr:hypothetical protein PPERSA_13009 [Pseudocohnilembus persalinus]|eukprot:KRX08528.1 hypothetical protein PPERSA_13009 [Pseudocohnilembus persalinus]
MQQQINDQKSKIYPHCTISSHIIHALVSEEMPKMFINNHLMITPILEENFEKALDLLAQTYSITNPMAVGLGKSFEDEKKRLSQNKQELIGDPFTFALYDLNTQQMIAVKFSSKYSSSYLGKLQINDYQNYDKNMYDEKQNTVIDMYRQVTQGHENLIKSNVFTFSIFGIRPDIQGKTLAFDICICYHAHMIDYVGGVYELGLVTNKKSYQYMNNRNFMIKLAEIDVKKVQMNGEYIFKNTENMCFVNAICTPRKIDRVNKFMEPQFQQYIQEFNPVNNYVPKRQHIKLLRPSL